MPGIFGIIAKTKTAQANLKSDFEGMARFLTHRDQYRLESSVGDHYVVGTLGLPFRGYRTVRFNPASQRGAAFHGYLYGWRGRTLAFDASRSEPVSLLPLEGHIDLSTIPAMLNGSFVVALFDLAADQFFFATDKLGYRRLYYYEDEHLVAVAPEMKAFLALDSFRPRLDETAAASLLNLGFVIGDRTLYEGVSLLRPGSILTVSGRKQLPPIRYYVPTFTEELDGDGDRLAKAALGLAEDVLERQLGGHHHAIVSLSGGMDSRLLAYLLSMKTPGTRYYSHGPPRSHDVVIARQVAATLSQSDNFTEIRPDPECYSKLGAWAAWLVDGMVGIASSYLIDVIGQYREDPLDYEFFNSIYTGAMNFASAYSTEADLSDNIDLEEKLRRLDSTLKPYMYDDFFNLVLTKRFQNRCRDTYRPLVLHEFKLVEDRGRTFANQKDAFFLETRIWRLSNMYEMYRYFFHDHFALIDDDFLEFYYMMPLKWRVDRRLYFKLYQDLLPQLARIRYQKTGVDLYTKPSPARLTWRNLSGKMRYYACRASAGRINIADNRTYSHPDKWYRDCPSNRLFFERLLLSDRCLSRGIFDEKGLRWLFAKQARGLSSFYLLDNFAALELFIRQFIEKEVPTRPF